jgi:hypothetical protein
MLAKRAVIAGVMGASVLLSAGCNSCPHKAYAQSLRPVEEVSVIAPARARVNVFLMNGADLLEVGGLSELKDGIVAGGFPKVYYAQRFDREWYRRELHRLHREDPDNRFVLIGYGTAADQLRQLAVQVAGEQIPLDRVIFLDPAGENADLTNCPFPSLVIRSHHWRLSPRLQPTESMTIHRTRHPNVPDSPATVQQVLEILIDSACRVPLNIPPIECVPEIDPKRPRPRPDQPKVMPPLPPEWQALCPQGM